MWQRRHLGVLVIAIVCAGFIALPQQLDAQRRLDRAIKKLTTLQSSPKKIGVYRMGQRGMFLPVPILFYSPETRLAYGANLQLLFRAKKDTVSPLSTVGISGYHTLNKQYTINPYWNLYLKEDKWRVAGAFLFRKYPFTFFGIGADTEYDDRERFTPQLILFRQKAMRRVANNFFVGLQYRLEYALDIEPKAGGILAADTIRGSTGYRASGIGLALVYDSRDNVFFPYEGFYLGVSNHNYQNWLGSEYNFSQFRFDGRAYWNTFRSHVWAFQVWVDVHASKPPFDMLAKMGGAFQMRGHFIGRFRERQQVVIQTEYRFKIWWRFIGTAFAGAGTVGNTFGDFNWKDMKYSAGVGLRYTLDPKERINVRLDYGFNFLGGDGPIGGWYLQISEAF